VSSPWPALATPGSYALLRGDCAAHLRRGPLPERAHLVYLDPPYNTDRDFGAFRDVWRWGPEAEQELAELARTSDGGRRMSMLLEATLAATGDDALGAYLCSLGLRLALLVERALHPAGTLVLHCDPSVSPYLRLCLDALLGRAAFLNELVWRYRRWPSRVRRLQRMHDTLLVYAAEPERAAQRPFVALTRERAPSTQRRWGEQRIRAVHDAQGKRQPSRAEVEASPGVPLDDVWELPIVAPSGRERCGFPTQKPLALLARLVEIYSEPGQLVLDPYCGSGTTLVAACAAGRRALGLDVEPAALALARGRLEALSATEGAQSPQGTLP